MVGVLAIALAIALAGCIANPPTPVASPSPARPAAPSADATAGTPSDGPSPAPSIDLTGLDEATAMAVRIRMEWGLPSDLAFIAKVAADPTATSEFGAPFLPSEIAEIGARGERADRIIPIVQQYAAGNTAVFGGLWIDQSAGGLVTASFTDDLVRHQAVLADLLAGQGVVRIVQARYAESVMRALQDRITTDRAWFETIPAKLLGVGYDVIANAVEINVSTANPDVAALVSSRYGIPPEALKVISDGTGVALEPWGTIHVRIVDVPAEVRAELTLNYQSDRPGAGCGRGDMGIGFGAATTVDLPCQGGHWTIEAIRTIEDVVARGEVDLAPGGTATVTLRPVAP